jgi:hypothetical protein
MPKWINPQTGAWEDDPNQPTPTNNVGTPGSRTAEINSQWRQDGNPWVDTGDTGGSLNGVTTIGEGRSYTPGQQASDRAAMTASGLSPDEIARYQRENPGDENRWREAFNQRGAGGSGSGGNGGGSISSQWNSGSLGGRADDFYNQLKARSQQSLNVSRTDPTIRPQADAYAANQERARSNYLNDQAEKQGPLANLLGESRLTAQRAGQATGAYEGELMGRELSARRDEIAQALQLMAGRLTTEQQLALQEQLGLIDEQLRSRGLDIQATQQGNQYDLGLRNVGLGQYQAQNQNDQFYANLVR